MKHPTPCLGKNAALEEAAAIAERRKLRALDRLMGKLGVRPERDEFEAAMHALVDADKAALEAKGR